jgi:predicted TPR repeat methyltransferase
MPDFSCLRAQVGACVARPIDSPPLAMATTDDQLAEALKAQADALYEAGEDAQARPLLERYVALRANDAEACYRLANVLKDAGDLGQAERLYRDALALRPEHARSHNNLGVVMELTGRVADARGCYETAVRLDAGLLHARLNLGRMCEELGSLAEAAEHYRAAAQLGPGELQPHAQLGRAMQMLGRPEEAAVSYRRVFELAPERFGSYDDLGRALVLTGRAAEAVEVYEQAIARGIDPEYFRHLVHAASGENSERPPEGYVRGLFDRFADGFERQLVDSLAYRVPATLAERVTSMSDGRSLAILDLGCGTGLCGQHFRTHAHRLVGVDLSPGMLRQAAAKGVYDELAEAELTAYLKDTDAAAFDLVVATDVLIYLGDLTGLFSGVRKVLKSGGLFALSTESLDDAQSRFRLRQSGRYAHASFYLRSLAAGFDFDELSFERAVIRTEGGKPMPGDLVVLRRR